jgi:hypothetical protein
MTNLENTPVEEITEEVIEEAAPQPEAVDANTFKEEITEMVKAQTSQFIDKSYLTEILPGLITAAVKSVYSKRIVVKSTPAPSTDASVNIAEEVIARLKARKY